MDKNNNILTVALLALIAGLIIGYFFGGNGMMRGSGFYSNNHMYEEMGEHMYGDDIIDRDGAMIHAMDEMMLGFRGKAGAEYEEMFLRSMIVHHLGAVNMSRDLLENTDRPELVQFAQNVIEVQSQEVETMKGWLDAWFANEN